jgi:hypothetical protein
MTIEPDRPFWFTVKVSPKMTAPMGKLYTLLDIYRKKQARLKPKIRNLYLPYLVALKKRSDQTSLNYTLLKKGISYYN